MVRDHLYYHARIREAERLRSEALGNLLAAAWLGAERLVTGAYRALLALMRHNRPAHH
jgi:hypothetical protein